MKIVSMNREHTTGPKEVALNVDEDLSTELVRKLEYGGLRFSFHDRVLIVRLPTDDPDPLRDDAIDNLNTKLAQAAQELHDEAAKRDRMLAGIAATAGLPLD